MQISLGLTHPGGTGKPCGSHLPHEQRVQAAPLTVRDTHLQQAAHEGKHRRRLQHPRHLRRRRQVLPSQQPHACRPVRRQRLQRMNGKNDGFSLATGEWPPGS